MLVFIKRSKNRIPFDFIFCLFGVPSILLYFQFSGAGNQNTNKPNNMMSKLTTTTAALAGLFVSSAHAWLPDHKLRGVNVGTLFVYEPWIDSQEWSNMGCSGQKSEFDCVMSIGQDAANTAFQKHWDSWIGAADLDEMKSYGLNTIRVPLGYWFKEDLVDSSEHFAKVRLNE